MHMLLTGEPVTADEALRLGLVNKVVPHGTELDAALTVARLVASKSKATVKIGKEAFYRQADMGLAEAYAYAAEVMTENMMTHDANEGICAFIEKRTAVWEDR
jgi:enoyl-CoA hydratase/carnithine racemase